MKDPIEAAIEQGRAESEERDALREERIRQAPVEAQRLGNYVEQSVVVGLQDLKLTLTKPIDAAKNANARTLELTRATGQGAFLVRLRIVVPYGAGTPEFDAYAAFKGHKRPLRLVFSHDEMKFTENIGRFREEILRALKEMA